MKLNLRVTLITALGTLALSGCAPAILAGMGAGAVVAADKVSEDKKGGDGIF